MGYLTGEQLRAARAMLALDQEEVAKRADVSVKTIKRLEATRGPIDARSEWRVRNAYEVAGIEFIEGDDRWGTRGEGVRFSADRTAKIRHDLMDAITLHLPSKLVDIAKDDEDFFERPIEQVVEKIATEAAEIVREQLRFLLRRNE